MLALKSLIPQNMHSEEYLLKKNGIASSHRDAKVGSVNDYVLINIGYCVFFIYTNTSDYNELDMSDYNELSSGGRRREV